MLDDALLLETIKIVENTHRLTGIYQLLQTWFVMWVVFKAWGLVKK